MAYVSYKTNTGIIPSAPKKPARPAFSSAFGDMAEQVGTAMLSGGRQDINYTAKAPDAYLTAPVKNQLYSTGQQLTEWKPQVARLSADTYQKMIDDSMAPLRKEYDRAREQARGDLAAEGTIYDYSGHDSMRKMGDDYLTNIGNVVRGVEIQREQDLMKDAQMARELDLQARTAAANQAGNTAQLFSTVGQGESELATKTGLENQRLEDEFANSLTGYLTGKYKAESDSYGTERQADVDQYRAEREAEDALRQRWIQMLDLPGYGDLEGGEDMYSAVGQSLWGGGGLPSQYTGGSTSPGDSATGIAAGSDRERELGLTSFGFGGYGGGAMGGAQIGSLKQGSDGRYYERTPTGWRLKY